MYNINKNIEKIFNTIMQIDGNKVTTLYENNEVDCFFRTNSDGISQKDTMIMFYGLDAPIHNGTIIVFRGDNYIALNKETSENDVYYKSAIVKANGEITTSDFSVVGLPFYSADINSGNAKDGTYIRVIDGRMEVITEDCETSRKLKINDIFNAWGRTWQIDNLYFVDGIAHIVLQVTSDKIIEHRYTLSLAPLNVLSAIVGDTLNLYATAYCDGNVDSAAILMWNSSDNNVATIDADGKVTFVGAGSVTFSVCWNEHNLTEYSNAIECVEAEQPETLALYVASANELYCDFDNDPIEYYVTRGGQKVTDIPITFTAEYPASATLQKKITIEVSDNSVLVNPADSRLLGKVFTLVASNQEYGLEHTQEIKVISIW